MDLSDIVAAIRRRWRIVAASVVLAAVAVGVFIFTREQTLKPDQFVSSVRVYLPDTDPDPREPSRSPVSGEDMPFELEIGQEGLAQSPEVRQAALEESGLPPDDTSVRFSASLNDEQDGTQPVITLAATSRDAERSRQVAESWGQTYRDARRQVSAEDIEGRRGSLRSDIADLRRERQQVNQQIVARLGFLPELNPVTPEDGEPTVAVPLGTDLETEQLLYQRVVLNAEYEDALFQQGELASDSVTPSPFAQVYEPAATARIVDEASSPIVPSAIIMLAGLAVGLAGALIRDRLDPAIRSAKVAAAALSAPVLASIPPPGRREEYAVLERPNSERSEAFRTLAATCVATDKLPSAIVVSTPRGDTLDDVAANLAAALAKLGLKVALVATSPEQTWYARPFEDADEVEGEQATLPALLTEAHAGRLNGKVTRRLPLTDFTPNLVLVPPGPDRDLALPLDGLPPLLKALADSGIDVTVIAGPPLLDDPNATIVAWATGTVLWAVQVDRLTQEEATEAAARLELSGVTPFGVVVVGAPES